MYACTLLVRNLLADVGDHSTPTGAEETIEEVNKRFLRNNFVKKLEPDDTAAADSAALAVFLGYNARCQRFKLAPSCPIDHEVLDLVRQYLDEFVFYNGATEFIHDSELLDRAGHGSGASIGADDNTFYSKMFSGPLKGTSHFLYALYLGTIKHDPRWREAELRRYARHRQALIRGSSLSYVPKTSEISRTICTEPPLNMFFQKALQSKLEERLRQYLGINLATQQSANRALARAGSISGSFATIDLRSASDSISLELCRQLLPRDLLRWLEAVRCPSCRLPDGRWVNLDMISSMGNATTFPLQTLIFAVLVKAVYRVLGIATRRCDGKQPNFGVNGDDIIVVTEAYPLVCRMLELMGFTVNTEKSFSTGYFRESCGGDYWKGYDVRALYIKRLKHVTDVYAAHNRCLEWEHRTGISLSNTRQALIDMVPPVYRLFTPRYSGYISGFHTSCAEAHVLNELALKNARALKVAPDLWLDNRLVKPKRQDFLNKQLAVLRRSPRRYKSWVADPPKSSAPDDLGAYLCFIGGFVRDGTFTVRPDDTRVKVLSRSYANWHSWDDPLPYNLDNLRLSDRAVIPFARPRASKEKLASPVTGGVRPE